MPIKTFDSMVEKIKELQPDIVFWTGDFPPHEIDEQTFENASGYQKILTQALEEFDAEVFGIMGNHDYATLNS